MVDLHGCCVLADYVKHKIIVKWCLEIVHCCFFTPVKYYFHFKLEFGITFKMLLKKIDFFFHVCLHWHWLIWSTDLTEILIVKLRARSYFIIARLHIYRSQPRFAKNDKRTASLLWVVCSCEFREAVFCACLCGKFVFVLMSGKKVFFDDPGSPTEIPDS